MDDWSVADDYKVVAFLNRGGGGGSRGGGGGGGGGLALAWWLIYRGIS